MTRAPRIGPPLRRLAVVVPLLLVALVAGVAQTGPGRSALRAAGLVPRTAPVTELAFTTPTQLPTTLTRRHRVRVSFAARRTTGASIEQAWAITASHGQGPAESLASGSMRVAADGWSAVHRSVHVPCHDAAHPSRTKVAVSMGSESIDFWVGCGAVA